jgi:predicted DNA binding CopG/RHH family protein
MDKYVDEYDDEEKEILAAFEAGELQPIQSDPELLELHRRYARYTLAKDKRINIRLSAGDLEAIKIRAIEEGIPYQTLMGSILHKFAAGRLVERAAAA